MKITACVCALLLSFSLAARAWDPGGHMLVGQIAWEQMTPAARDRAGALVATLEKTYNAGQPYNFITAGCWMDDMRASKDYAWSKWHYVNLAWTPSGTPCEIPKEGPHVVWAIDENIKTLRDPQATPAQASLALAMLIHFVGDLHQPMHATERGDRGGNGFLISGVPFSDLFPGTVPNLHAFWDKAYRYSHADGAIVEMWQAPLIEGRPKAPGEGIIAEQAAKIVAAVPRESLFHLGELSATAWARESHTIGCLAAYPLGPRPTDHEVVKLTPEFAHHSGRIAEQRVALAGYRLALLLNDLFGPKTAALPGQ